MSPAELDDWVRGTRLRELHEFAFAHRLLSVAVDTLEDLRTRHESGSCACEWCLDPELELADDLTGALWAARRVRDQLAELAPVDAEPAIGDTYGFDLRTLADLSEVLDRAWAADDFAPLRIHAAERKRAWERKCIAEFEAEQARERAAGEPTGPEGGSEGPTAEQDPGADDGEGTVRA